MSKKKITSYRDYRRPIADRFFKCAMPIARKIHIQNKKRKTGLSLQEGRIWSDKLTSKEDLIMNLSQVMAEIESSLERIAIISNLFTSHSSYHEKKGFSRVQQHRRNIEWYFNEIYTLSERVLKFLKLLKKNALRVGFLKDSAELRLLSMLIDTHVDTVSGIIKLRGHHVHDRSYSDNDLFRVELLEMSLKNYDFHGKDREYLFEDLKFDLKLDRKRWQERIKKDLLGLEELLGYLYYSLNKEKIMSKVLKGTETS